jgi:hypothetical protein
MRGQQSRARSLLYTVHVPLRKLLLVRRSGTQRGTPAQGCSAQLQGECLADRLQLLSQSGEKTYSEQETVSAQEGIPWGEYFCLSCPHGPLQVGTLLPLHRLSVELPCPTPLRPLCYCFCIQKPQLVINVSSTVYILHKIIFKAEGKVAFLSQDEGTRRPSTG